MSWSVFQPVQTHFRSQTSSPLITDKAPDRILFHRAEGAMKPQKIISYVFSRKKKSSILPQRLTKRRIHLTHTHTALGIVQIRPGQQDLRKNCDHPNTLLHRRMLARPTVHLMYLTSFSARIDSFHSLLCRVYIVHDAHGVPNARYSHKSTADHLKCDPRKDHSSWTRVYV